MWVVNTTDGVGVKFSPISRLWNLKLSCGTSLKAEFLTLSPELICAAEEAPAELACPEDCQKDCVVRVASGAIH